MADALIRYQVMNRKAARSMVLLHGLYTSAGYWLPYLPLLSGFRLILLTIDYQAIRDLPPYIARLEQLIEQLAEGQADTVIAHSLGCLLAHQLPPERRRHSYEICPVYLARPRAISTFVAELGQRLPATPAAGDVQARLADIGAALALHGNAADHGAIRYIPDADAFFSYRDDPAQRHFHGDHFDISAALQAICAELG
ncbi:alpha/beta fold hydrolase [Duganella qianjiadongensis]|uniref:Alpha/beta fold hydrolase n=1 Tax=Duganella qianjiadongensis TaxID=2692176 RepID=A0ABW9VQ11_9BURK|nr:alpha/beta fold hydrolase [Duganella qianjiadongensis]MYM41236.1 alpha/beta fold hydrolase [Duganella qianjiadongensis]